MNTMYLLTLPFRGHVQTTVKFFDDGHSKVAYSGGLSLEEYLGRNEGIDLILRNEEEVSGMFDDFCSGMKSDPEEIDSEKYHDMLNVLPPCRWESYGGGSAFHISERLYGNIVSWYVSKGDKFYEFTDEANLSVKELDKKIGRL